MLSFKKHQKQNVAEEQRVEQQDQQETKAKEQKEGPEAVVGDVFPCADDMKERAKNKWKDVTIQEVFKEIFSESEKGQREACFSKCKFSKEIIEFLNAKGYHVTVNEKSGFCIVSW